MFSDEQIEKLGAPLDEGRVKQHPQSGKDYLETWDVIAQANDIFGPANWDSAIIHTEEVHEKGWRAVIRITVRADGDTITREDSGWQPYAIGERGITGETIDAGVKGAVSDALKRALRSFGEQFGNTLYNKNRRGNAPPQQQAQRPPPQQQQAGDDEYDNCPNCSKRKRARFPVCFECKEAGRTTPEPPKPPPPEQYDSFDAYWDQVKALMTLAQFNEEFHRIKDTGHRQQKAYLLQAARGHEFTFDATTGAFVDPLARTGQGEMMDTGPGVEH